MSTMKNKTITQNKQIIDKKQNGYILKLALPCDRGFHWIGGLLSVLFFVCNTNKILV